MKYGISFGEFQLSLSLSLSLSLLPSLPPTLPPFLPPALPPSTPRSLDFPSPSSSLPLSLPPPLPPLVCSRDRIKYSRRCESKYRFRAHTHAHHPLFSLSPSPDLCDP